MKFSEYLVKITGVSIYPVLSLVLFVAFFIAVTYWVYKIDKTEIERIGNLPLEEN